LWDGYLLTTRAQVISGESSYTVIQEIKPETLEFSE